MTDALHNYDAAIFDMDGTLIDSMRYWRYTTLEYLLAHQLPIQPEDLVRMIDVSSRRMLFDIAQRDGIEIGTEQEVIQELEGYMNRHYLYDVRLKGGVSEFLQALHGMGIAMCVATASPREYAENALRRLGILDCFDFVTDSYETGITKHQPEYFVQVAARMGTVPERCLVFEDALYAMETAKAAGCCVMAIRDDTARLQRDRILQVADRYFESYAELLCE